MTKVYANGLGGWTAEYRDREGYWRVARDARFVPINCETATLARSVARWRRRRLRRFQ